MVLASSGTSAGLAGFSRAARGRPVPVPTSAPHCDPRGRALPVVITRAKKKTIYRHRRRGMSNSNEVEEVVCVVRWTLDFKSSNRRSILFASASRVYLQKRKFQRHQMTVPVHKSKRILDSSEVQ